MQPEQAIAALTKLTRLRRLQLVIPLERWATNVTIVLGSIKSRLLEDIACREAMISMFETHMARNPYSPLEAIEVFIEQIESGELVKRGPFTLDRLYPTEFRAPSYIFQSTGTHFVPIT